MVKLEEFLKDPWGLKAKQPATIQVKVPKLNVAPPPQVPKKAASASMMAKDFARQFESGDVEVRNRSSKKRLYERHWWRRTVSIECQSDVQAILFQ